MSQANHPLSQAEFDSVFSKVPRLTVEIIIKSTDGEVYLTKRAIPPCVGQWHLPGGTVRFGELLIEAVKRVAKRELGIMVEAAQNVGYFEYVGHYKEGLDYPVGIAFEVTRYSGEIAANEESADGGWFKKVPNNLHADLDEFLLARGYLRK